MSTLKIDFPRLPLPSSPAPLPDSLAGSQGEGSEGARAAADVFHELAALGAKLVALHLLESPALTPTGIAYPVSGTHVVEKRSAARRYAPRQQTAHRGACS